MFNCDLPHLIEGFRRQNGISYAQLAERMGWPVGTLTSYMHRLRAGRPATREDLDDFARGLSDPRFELGDEVVVRHHLHAAAGVTPTPEEVADFLSDYFPKAPEDPNPSYLFDIRGYVRWVNPRMASLTAAMGGPPAAEITVRAHAWVLADIRGRLPERLALPKVVDAAPDASASTQTPCSASGTASRSNPSTPSRSSSTPRSAVSSATRTPGRRPWGSWNRPCASRTP